MRTDKLDNDKLYKVLNADGSCYHGGVGRWHLPRVGKDGRVHPGKWMPKIKGTLKPCVNGYHVLKPEMLIDWIAPAPVAVFEVETRDKVVWAGNKGVVREVRLIRRVDSWTEQAARLFACDCSEHLRGRLITSEQVELDACLLTIRRYAFGMVSESELDLAEAWAEAWAWAGAGARAGAGAGVPEKEWNTKRLFEYLRGEVDIEEIKRKVQP